MAKKAELKARLSLNSAAFTRGLAMAGAQAKRFATGAGKMGLNMISRGMKLAAISTIAASAAFSVGVKNAYDLGGKLSDLASRTALSAGEALIWGQAFADAGMDASAVGPVVNKLQRAMDGVNESGGKTTSIFTEMGLDLRVLRRLNPSGQMVEIGRALNRISDPAERASSAMKIFGKSGGEMLTLFADSGAFANAAESLGRQAQILERSAANFDAISDSIGHIPTKIQGFFVGFADSIQGPAKELLDRMEKTDFVELGQRAGNAFVSALNSAAGILDGIQATVSSIGNKIGAAFDSLYAKWMKFANEVIRLKNLATGLLGGEQTEIPYGEDQIAAALESANTKQAAVTTMTYALVEAFSRAKSDIVAAFLGPVAGGDGEAKKSVTKARTLLPTITGGIEAQKSGKLGSDLVDALTPRLRSITNPTSLILGDTHGGDQPDVTGLGTMDRTGNPNNLTGGIAGQSGVKTIPSALSFRERRAMMDAQVAAGGMSRASSAGSGVLLSGRSSLGGAYGAVRSGDTRRRKEYQRQQERLNNGQATSNEALNSINQAVQVLVKG